MELTNFSKRERSSFVYISLVLFSVQLVIEVNSDLDALILSSDKPIMLSE